MDECKLLPTSSASVMASPPAAATAASKSAAAAPASSSVEGQVVFGAGAYTRPRFSST